MQDVITPTMDSVLLSRQLFAQMNQLELDSQDDHDSNARMVPLSSPAFSSSFVSLAEAESCSPSRSSSRMRLQRSSHTDLVMPSINLRLDAVQPGQEDGLLIAVVGEPSQRAQVLRTINKPSSSAEVDSESENDSDASSHWLAKHTSADQCCQAIDHAFAKLRQLIPARAPLQDLEDLHTHLFSCALREMRTPSTVIMLFAEAPSQQTLYSCLNLTSCATLIPVIENRDIALQLESDLESYGIRWLGPENVKEDDVYFYNLQDLHALLTRPTFRSRLREQAMINFQRWSEHHHLGRLNHDWKASRQWFFQSKRIVPESSAIPFSAFDPFAWRNALPSLTLIVHITRNYIATCPWTTCTAVACGFAGLVAASITVF